MVKYKLLWIEGRLQNQSMRKIVEGGCSNYKTWRNTDRIPALCMDLVSCKTSITLHEALVDRRKAPKSKHERNCGGWL